MAVRRHAVVAGAVLAGLASQVWEKLREGSSATLAAEGVGSLMGAPGVGTLAAALAQATGGALGALGVNLLASRIHEHDDPELNHDLDHASGMAIAALVRRAGGLAKSLRKKNAALTKLAAAIEKDHDPTILDRADGPAPPIKASEFVEDSAGFMNRTALTGDQWLQYLEDMGRERGLPIHLIRSNLRKLADVLHEHYADALYRALKADTPNGRKAFAGTVLRMLNVLLSNVSETREDVREIRATTEATWRAVLNLKSSGDVELVRERLEALATGSAERAESLEQLSATVLALPERLDRIEAVLNDVHRLVAENNRVLQLWLEKRGSAEEVPGSSPSNISELKWTLQGRDELIDKLDDLFADTETVRVVVLHGQPGLGKSEVAYEYARRFADRYPGGRLTLDASDPGPAVDLVKEGRTWLGLKAPMDLPIEEQGLHILAQLGTEPTLLIYDGASGEESLQGWIPRSGARCHVIVTTNADAWDPSWSPHAIPPIGDLAARALVDELAGPDATEEQRADVLAGADGMAVQLVPNAIALSVIARRALRTDAPTGITKEAMQSFDVPFASLEPEQVLVLLTLSTLRHVDVPVGELSRLVQPSMGWTDDEFLDHLEACLDVSLIVSSVGGYVSMHQVIAKFVGTRTSDPRLDGDALSKVCLTRAERFVELAGGVGSNPADADLVALFGLYSEDLADWSDAGTLTGRQYQTVGYAFSTTGRFRAALPWFERAVTEKERDDVDGRVDHESVSKSLHLAGWCLSQQGQIARAQGWFERAVSESNQGDVLERVNHESVGTSLHQVGWCLAQQGRHAKAQGWFKRAVTEKQKGDIHERVDHGSVGKSLHQVGMCLAARGQHAEAQGWFKRAVTDKEKGDVDGRVDHESVGKSLHQVGWCLSQRGRHAVAQSWFERAVTAAKKGDVHGRVDHESVSKGLHEVGWCLSEQGQDAEAQGCFERAVTEAKQGDVHGRVDHESVGKSLHEVGWRLSRRGRHAKAYGWFKRAVTEKQRGDVYGRVNHGSVGESLLQVGWSLSQQGRHAKAQSWYERAVTEQQQGDVHGRVDAASIQISLGALELCRKAQDL